MHKISASGRRRNVRRLIALPTAALTAASIGFAAMPGTASAAASNDDGYTLPTEVKPDAPKVVAPPALPKKTGEVPVTQAPQARTLTTAAKPKVALRALVVATDDSDYGLPTWTSTLDRVGAAYDVVKLDSDDITSDKLVDAAGNGKYNAILLTNSMMLKAESDGGYTNVMSNDEWNALWKYERTYSVRQATLFASYGTFPEDYCMRAGSEGGVGSTPIKANLTTAGAKVFDYLKAGASIPVQDSYVYSNTVDTECGGQPLLTSGDNVLGVTSTSDDGRERAALSFSNNQYLMQSTLLTYGLFRWASKGLFLGQQQNSLKLDVDDYFGGADLIQPDRTIKEGAYEMSGSDVLNAAARQSDLKYKYPLASDFEMTLAFNGAEGSYALLCNPFGGGAWVMSWSTKCVDNKFEWINHTYSHANMNNASLTTATSEISKNNTFATFFPLKMDRTILKTGEYSGLGVYNPSGDSVEPPTDFGLNASNPNLLRAATNQGIKYLHGNMSFKSHLPSCFNCNVPHPMSPNLSIVPDWPTNIAYFSSTPAEEVTFYNWYYGPGGLFPAFDKPQTYDQIIDNESNIALSHIATGSVYSHTMHIANLRNYGGGKTLATDWLGATMSKYSQYYNVPLLSPSWGSVANLTSVRNSHFGARDKVDALYDPNTNTVTVSSPTAATIQMTGAAVPGATKYGTSSMGSVALPAGVSRTYTVTGLPR